MNVGSINLPGQSTGVYSKCPGCGMPPGSHLAGCSWAKPVTPAWPTPFTLQIVSAPPQGWQCPACGRVWAPGMAGCATCAEKATEREKAAEKQEAVSQQPEVGLSGHLPLGGTVLL